MLVVGGQSIGTKLITRNAYCVAGIMSIAHVDIHQSPRNTISDTTNTNMFAGIILHD